jgi:hypothetical protein
MMNRDEAFALTFEKPDLKIVAAGYETAIKDFVLLVPGFEILLNKKDAQTLVDQFDHPRRVPTFDFDSSISIAKVTYSKNYTYLDLAYNTCKNDDWLMSVCEITENDALTLLSVFN